MVVDGYIFATDTQSPIVPVPAGMSEDNGDIKGRSPAFRIEIRKGEQPYDQSRSLATITGTCGEDER